MATKAQHARSYRSVPVFLRRLREEASLTQRELGSRLKRPQSWIYNCETANRRVDVTEFVAWARACAVDPAEALARLLDGPEGPTKAKGNKPAGGQPAPK